MSTDENVTRVRYKAFISYSHRDSAVARWLHRALETYRVPSHLIGRTTAAGKVEKRLGALFRDRDELPVAADLTGQINDALKATQFLIVLCSTASAQSKWVNQEVVNFKRLKGAGSIIAVIVDGEPYASTMPGREAEECFVPALRFQVAADGSLTDTPAEPIAADLRPGKDGKRLVKLKVLAGLLGVGLDELVQRETQRRQRFMAAVTFASLAGVATMGALTFNAIEARNEAETKREQAEGLVEYMLSDLGERLQAVGRLDVLDSLSSRTLEYYARQKPEDLDSDALGRRARALILLGKIEDQKGNREAARDAFIKARDTTAERMARDPNSPSVIFDHAQSVYWVGNVDWRAGLTAEAEPEFREYARLASTLKSSDPDNIRWIIEQGYAETNLGVLMFQAGRFSEAREHFDEAWKLKERAFRSDPDSTERKLDMGQSLAWLADTHRALGELSKAIERRSQEVEVYDSLLKSDPRNVIYLQRMLLAKRFLALVALDSGDVEISLNQMNAAIELAETLHRIEPENAVWEERRARSYLDLAEALLITGKYTESAQQLEIGKKITNWLTNKDANNWRWQTLLLANALVIDSAIATRNSGRAPDVLELGRLTDSLRLLEQRHPKEIEILRAQAKLLFAQGEIFASSNQPEKAADYWRSTYALLRSMPNLQNQDKILMASTLRMLGQTDVAANVISSITAADYRHPLLQQLKSRIVGLKSY